MSTGDSHVAPVPLSAILCVFGAFFAFSCADTGAKIVIGAGLHPAFVSWMRFVVHSVLAMLFLRIWCSPRRFRPRKKFAHLVRGSMLFLSGLMSFSAVGRLQLAEFISMVFMAPLVITAISSLLLREHVEWQRWLAVAFGLCGVLVITRPGFGAFHIGHALAIGAMLTYCVFTIMTRYMSASESQEALLLLPALVAVAGMLPALPYVAAFPSSAVHWLILLSLGLFGAAGHWLLISAYRTISASTLAPYAYTQMIWTIAFGYLIFGDLPDVWMIVGSAVIIGSGLYLMRRDRHRLPASARSQRSSG